MSADVPPALGVDFLDDFYAEADDHLGNIRAQLSALETVGEAETQRVALESVYHSIHSLKGLSAMVGLAAAERLAHASEDFLRPFSRRQRRLTPGALDLLMTAAQALEQIVAAHRARRPVPQPEKLIAQLSAPASAAAAESDAPAPATDEAAIIAGLVAKGLAAWRCTFQPSRELDQRGVNISAIRTRLGAVGEIARATPRVRPGGIEFEFIVGFREAPADLAAWANDGVALAAIEHAPAPPTETEEAQTEATTPSSLSIAPSHLVRVDLERLDELMRIAGELVVHRSRLEERIQKLAGVDDEVKEASRALARSLRQLRGAITRVRLVPVAEIFTRLPFVVRDLARESGKNVRLVLEGQHTPLDKYLVERLKEPLLHLVRNAFSHGVEAPAERAAAGKPPEATIRLRARTAGEFVIVDIRDDGRGIDAAAVARRAAELGMPVPAELDDAAVLRILCTSGFSTRQEADRAAGRGVGMSVVYNTVRELGGALTLESTPGEGTQFTMRLPLTLSIAQTIIVSAGGQTCAVPQAFIEEIIQVPEAEVRAIRQSEVIPYREGVLPLLRLRTMFGAARSERPEVAVLVLSSERGATGLAVDRVHAQREIVVRPMADPLLQVPGIAGATELGDGKPVLILDPMAITRGVVRPRADEAPAAVA